MPTDSPAANRISATKSLRARVNEQLDPAVWPGPSSLSPVNKLVIALILASVAFAIAESEPLLLSGREHVFRLAEQAFGIAFLIEYVVRVWSIVEDPRYGPGLAGRWRYVKSPAALLDLFALLPLFVAAVGAEAYLSRILRLVRVLRIARLGRFSKAFDVVAEAVNSRRFELIASVCIALLLLLISSTLMHLVEGSGQPEQFGSIPRAMWWSVATLTTVGYGDVVPLTMPGKLLAGVTAIIGIGLIAMPTGILAAAFSEALRVKHAHDLEAQHRRASGKLSGAAPKATDDKGDHVKQK